MAIQVRAEFYAGIGVPEPALTERELLVWVAALTSVVSAAFAALLSVEGGSPSLINYWVQIRDRADTLEEAVDRLIEADTGNDRTRANDHG